MTDVQEAVMRVLLLVLGCTIAAAILGRPLPPPVPPAASAYFCLKQPWEAVPDFGLCRDREPELMPL